MSGTQSKYILVTGGTGFVGAYLLRHLLDKGYTRIRALKRPASPTALVADLYDRIEWVEGDLFDIVLLEDLMRESSDVYHCAAMVSFLPGDRKAMFRVNEEGTANVVNTALYGGVRKLVHVSSVAAIGRPEKQTRFDEANIWVESPLNTQYAISKFLGEQQVWRGMAEGLTAAIVNPATIIGSGYWDQGTGRLFGHVWEGNSFYPRGSTGFVDVRDVVRFMVALMESDICDERFILCSDNRSWASFFGLVAAALDRKTPSVMATPFLGGLAWRAARLQSLFTGKKPLITRETVMTSASDFSYDNRKSLSALDFSYRLLEETVRQTAEQFREAAAQGFRPMLLPR